MYKQLFALIALLSMAECSIKEGQKLSDFLWEATAEYRQQALNASLIQGMVKKCLDPSAFGGYMVDDTVYCYEGSESLKIAGGRSNDNVTLQTFLNLKAESWVGYWERLNEIWHIKNAEGVRLGEAAKAYVNHIRNVSESQEPVYTVLALTPCAKLWPWLGQQIGASENNFGVYTSWVKENLDPESTGYKKYEQQVEWAYEAGTVTADKALEIFTTSMQNEVNFFNSVARCGCGANVPSCFLLLALLLISSRLYHP